MRITNSSNRSKHRKMKAGNSSGFTLIEVMIVIAILGILAAIAFPSYQSSVIKAGRADGKVALLGAAQAMERCASSNNNSYIGCDIPDTSGEGKYDLDFAAGFPTASAFRITATPAVGTSQLNDTECANLGIDHTGQRFISGTGTVVTCW